MVLSRAQSAETNSGKLTRNPDVNFFVVFEQHRFFSASSARSSRKRLLNARLVASGLPPGFLEQFLESEFPPGGLPCPTGTRSENCQGYSVWDDEVWDDEGDRG
jgi:hypothetical protein